MNVRIDKINGMELIDVSTYKLVCMKVYGRTITGNHFAKDD